MHCRTILTVYNCKFYLEYYNRYYCESKINAGTWTLLFDNILRADTCLIPLENVWKNEPGTKFVNRKAAVSISNCKAVPRGCRVIKSACIFNWICNNVAWSSQESCSNNNNNIAQCYICKQSLRKEIFRGLRVCATILLTDEIFKDASLINQQPKWVLSFLLRTTIQITSKNS